MTRTKTTPAAHIHGDARLSQLTTLELRAQYQQTRNLAVELGLISDHDGVDCKRLLGSLRGYRDELVRRDVWVVPNV